jgi:hypothetical protein
MSVQLVHMIVIWSVYLIHQCVLYTDTDECTAGTDDCDQVCTNTDGSYTLVPVTVDIHWIAMEEHAMVCEFHQQ